MFSKARSFLREQSDVAPVLGVGVVFRLFLMPLTWHNDAVWAPWMAHFVGWGHLNVYQTLFDQFGDTVLSPTVWAPYLPLYYFVMGGWTRLLKMLRLLDVSAWEFSYTGWTIDAFPRAVFLMKLPYLVVDLLIWGLVILMIEFGKRKRFSWLYLFFPSQLWVSFVMGQNDTLPTLMTIVALYCASRCFISRRFLWAAVCVVSLGVGAAFKSYPLFLLVPTAIVLSGSISQIILLFFIGIAPFLIVIAPFLGTPAFVEGALFNHEGMSLFSTAIGSGLYTAPVFLILYGLLLSFLLFGSYQKSLRTLRFVYLVALSLLFVFSAWPFNWLVWLVPFLAWSVVEEDIPDILYAFIGVYFTVLLTGWGKNVGGYTFYPLGQPLRYFTGFRQLVKPYVDFLKMQQFFFAAFVVSIISILVLMLWRTPSRHKLNPSLGPWSAVGPALFTVCLVLATTWVGGRFYVVRDQGSTNGEPLLLATGDIVEQTLEMDVPGLVAVEIWVSAPVPDDMDGELYLLGWTESATIPPVVIPAVELSPNAMNRFELGEAYPAGDYTFQLSWHGTSSIVLGCSAVDALPSATMAVNGDVRNQDLAIRTIATSSRISVLRQVIESLGTDRIFTGGWLGSLLIVSLLTSWQLRKESE
jgi:hypothetical protein